MSHANDPSGTPAAPPLSELFTRYLERQAAAQSVGLGNAETAGEVVPFEAAPVQPVDPQLAWHDARAAVHFLCPETDTRPWRAPPDWSVLVATHEPATALAFCFGNFPQLVRNLQPLLHATSPAKLRPTTVTRPAAVPALLDWAAQVQRKKDYAQLLVAVGSLRLAGHFDRAAALLDAPSSGVPAVWHAAWENERAAVAWHRGQADEAAAMWRVQADSTPVLFNRGMAALFLDKAAEARPWLRRAVAQLPEESAWHHLGRLYLALAEMVP